MQDIRRVLCWIFAATCLLHLLVAARSTLWVIYRHIALSSRASLITEASISLVVALVCGAAWWNIWRGHRYARSWGIAASLANVSVFVRSNLVYPRSQWSAHLGALFIGVVGLIAFLQPYDGTDAD